MKKTILFVIVVLIILASVTIIINKNTFNEGEIEESNQKNEEINLGVIFEEGTYYAVENLGYKIEETHDLSNEEALILDLPGDEYYYIIPRYTNMSMKVYQNDFDEEKILIYSSQEAVPFVISGNQSDLFPNIEVELTTVEDEVITFSPYISLEDGSLIIEKGTEVINIF